MNKLKEKDADYLLKMGLVVIGIIVVIAIIIASWVWNLEFDPEHFNWNRFFRSVGFNGSISLVMLVLCFVAVNESFKAKKHGKYEDRRELFRTLVNELYDTGSIIYFDSFISWYAERQLRSKKIKYLTKKGMPLIDAEMIIDYATLDDLEKISGLKRGEKPTGGYGEDVLKFDKDGNEILIPAIKDTLVAFVEEALNGTITIDVESASYYTSEDRNKKADLESLERPQATDDDRVKSLRLAFLSRVAIIVLYGAAFAMLVVNLNRGISEAEAIWELVLSLASASLGLVGGGFIGANNAQFIYKWLGNKIRVIKEYNQFLKGGEYKPKSYAETVKERIAAAKKKAEEQRQSIIDSAPVPLLDVQQ